MYFNKSCNEKLLLGEVDFVDIDCIKIYSPYTNEIVGGPFRADLFDITGYVAKDLPVNFNSEYFANESRSNKVKRRMIEFSFSDLTDSQKYKIKSLIRH